MIIIGMILTQIVFICKLYVFVTNLSSRNVILFSINKDSVFAVSPSHSLVYLVMYLYVIYNHILLMSCIRLYSPQW